MLAINERLSIPSTEFEWGFARSGGPGGQNVNKLNTKVSLRWCIASSSSVPEDVKRRFMARYARRINHQGTVLVVSQRFRDQSRNVADCLAKLKAMLQTVAVPPKRRRATRPTKSSQERRLRCKRNRAETKHRRSATSKEI